MIVFSMVDVVVHHVNNLMTVRAMLGFAEITESFFIKLGYTDVEFFRDHRFSIRHDTLITFWRINVLLYAILYTMMLFTVLV